MTERTYEPCALCLWFGIDAPATHIGTYPGSSDYPLCRDCAERPGTRFTTTRPMGDAERVRRLQNPHIFQRGTK